MFNGAPFTRPYKTLSFLTLSIFLFEQIVWSAPQPVYMTGVEYEQPVLSESEDQIESSQDPITPGGTLETQSFLQGTSPLKALDSEGFNDKTKIDNPNNSSDNFSHKREFDRSSFEDAIEVFQPDYAAAVIVKDLTLSNLRQLLELPFEVGITVLEGEIILFSSGNRDEIRLNEPVKELIETSSFFAHTHPMTHHTEGPSALDLIMAEKRIEYVVTDERAYAYGGGSETSDLGHSRFIELLAKEVQGRDTHGNVAARSSLNKFIYEMDRLNELTAETFSARATDPVSTFTDDFNRSSIGASWSAQDSAWTISNQSMLKHIFLSGSANLGRLILDAPLASEDMDVQVRYQVQGNSVKGGVILRYQDPDNFYYASVSKYNNAQIYKRVNGVDTLIAGNDGADFASWTFHEVRAVIEDTEINLYIDGQLRVTTSDSTFTGGKAGIYSSYHNPLFDDFALQTLGDTNPPSISGVGASSITSESASITWTTDEPSDSQVEYRIQGTSTWSSTTLDANLITNHTIPLSGLTPDTIYEYRVLSRDASGNLAMPSTPLTLTTPSPIDTTPPSITGVNASSITHEEVSIAWNTDEPADSQVEYRIQGASIWSATALDPSTITNHVVNLTGLAGSAVYEYRILSRDSVGNLAIQDPILTFTTDTPPDITPPVITTDSVYFQPLVNQGLVSTWNLDSLQNNTVSDTGTGGNNGSALGSPSVLAEAAPTNYPNAGSIRFDGIDDTINMGNSSSLALTRYTISFWMNAESVSNGGRIFSRRNSTDWTRTNYIVSIGGTNDGASAGKVTITHVQEDNTVKSVKSTTNLFGAGWTHVVATYDGSFIRLFVDGIEQGVIGATAPDATGIQSLLIGRSQYASETGFFKGGLDEIAIYDRALSSQEIQNLTAGGHIVEPPAINTDSVTVEYQVDGTPRSKTFTGLTEGVRELRIVETDAAGNSSELVGYVTVAPETPPSVSFTSAPSSGTSEYTLTYTADSVAKSREWILGGGTNRLVAIEPGSIGSDYYFFHDVTWDAPAPAEPDLTAHNATALSELTAVTLEDGHVVHYKGSDIFSIELPGQYKIIAPESDNSGNLTGGLVVFWGGSRVFYHNGTAVWLEDARGSRYVYNSLGRICELIAPDGLKTSFAYRLDSNNEVDLISAHVAGTTTLYDADGTILSVMKSNGDRVEYAAGKISRVELATGESLYYTETAEAEGARLTINGAASTAYPSSILYDVSGEMLELTRHDSSRIVFNEGLPAEIIDSEGIKTVYEFDSNQADDLIGFNVVRNGFIQEFDSLGSLTGIELPETGNDTVIVNEELGTRVERFEVADGEIVGIVLSDGTQMALGDNGFNSTEQRLDNGTVTFPDGSTATYQNGDLVELINADGAIYDVTWDGANYIASLRAGQQLNNDETAGQMIYDADMKLVSMTRLNSEIVQFRDDKIDEIRPDCTQGETECEEPQFFYYLPNETVLVQGDYAVRPELAQIGTYAGIPHSISYYDLQGNPTGMRIVTEEGINLVEFAYGKIRRILACDGAAANCTDKLIYTYEFDELGNEITVITDPATEEVRRLMDEKLISVTTVDNVITEYSYGEDDRISSSTIRWYEKVLETYTYAYRDEEEQKLITDSQDVTRVYDSEDQLVGILQGDQEYKIHHFEENGEPRTAQELIREKKENGVTYHYQMGKIIRMEYPDGTLATDVIEDANGKIFSARLTHPDGLVERVVFGKQTDVSRSDASTWSYMEGKLTSIRDKYGKGFTFSQEGDNYILTAENGVRYLYDLAGTYVSTDTSAIISHNPADGSTDIRDLSNHQHAITAAGNARVTALDGAFGGSSVAFNGSGDYLTLNDSSAWDFGSGDFTVDFWVNPADLDGVQHMLTWDYINGSAYNGLNLSADGSLVAFLGAATLNGDVNYHQHVELRSAPGAVRTDEWQHVAIARTENRIRLFLNGTEVSAKDWTYAPTNSSAPMQIGTLRFESYVQDFHGKMDEIRFTKGKALWSDNFVPPQEPQLSSGPETALLLGLGDMSAYVNNRPFESFDTQNVSFFAMDFDALATTLSQTTEGPESDMNKVRIVSHTAEGLIVEHPNGALSEYQEGRLVRQTDAGTGNVREFSYAGSDTIIRDSGSEMRFDAGGNLIEFKDYTGRAYTVTPVISGAETVGHTLTSSDGLSISLSAEGEVVSAARGSVSYAFAGGELNSITQGTFAAQGLAFDLTENEDVFAPLSGFGGSIATNAYLGRSATIDFYSDAREGVAELIDLNGDGLPDRVLASDGNTHWKVQWNNGGGFDAPVDFGPIRRAVSSVRNDYIHHISDARELRVALIDLNGDNRPDRIQAFDGNPNWKVQWNTGSGFSELEDFGPIRQAVSSVRNDYIAHTSDSNELRVALIDLNGDNLPDRIQAFDGNGSWKVQWNTGTGFSELQDFGPIERAQVSVRNDYIEYLGGNEAVSVLLKDLNGDQKPDRIQAIEGSNMWKVQWNTGTGFGPMVDFGPVEKPVSATTFLYPVYPRNGEMVQLIDMNSDGLIDRVMNDGVSSTWYVQWNTGAGFSSMEEFADVAMMLNTNAYKLPHYVTGNMTLTELTDLNGDTLPDRILASEGNTQWQVQWNQSIEASIEHVEIYSDGILSTRIENGATTYSTVESAKNAAKLKSLLIEGRNAFESAAPDRLFGIRLQLNDLPLSVEDLTIQHSVKLITELEDASSSMQEFTSHGVVFHGMSAETRADFDGVDDYIAVSDQSLTDFGSEDFTIDLWFNASNINNTGMLWSKEIDGNNRMIFRVRDNGKIQFAMISNGETLVHVITDLNAFNLNEWTHAALVKNGGEYAIYVNGIKKAFTATTNNIVNIDAAFEIGRTFHGVAEEHFQGSMKNFRISKGISRWVNNFDPNLIRLAPDQNTHLLLFSDVPLEINRLRIIEAGEAKTITGDSVTLLVEGTEYTYEEGSLVKSVDTSGKELFYSRGGTDWIVTDGSFADRYSENGDYLSTAGPEGIFDLSAASRTATIVGEVSIDTSGSKFQNASIEFDGSYDYLTFQHHPDFQYEASDFTFDAWFQIDGIGMTQQIWSQYTGDPQNNQNYFFGVNPSGNLWTYIEKNGQPWGTVTGSGTLSPGTWYHGALVKSGNTLNLYLNGILQGSTTVSGTAPSGNFFLTAGGKARAGGTGYDDFFKGRIDELRVSRTARWTSDFSPPSSENDVDVSTILLLRTGSDRNSMPPATLNTSLLTLNTASLAGASAIIEKGSSGQPATGSLFSSALMGADFKTGQRSPAEVMYSVFDEEGALIYTLKVDGSLTQYENGKIKYVWGPGGVLVQSYEYDAEGNPLKITLHQMRDEFPVRIRNARLKVEQQKLIALRNLAVQQAEAVEQIASQFGEARSKLENQRQSLMAQRYQKVCTQTLCWTSCQTIEVPGVAAAIEQINSALVDLAQREAQAYVDLEDQILNARNTIETEIASAFAQIDEQETAFRREIVRQEISPIIFHYYRKYLGRDPSQAEYDRWISETDFDEGLDVARLKRLLTGKDEAGNSVESEYNAERNARQSSVDQIKGLITAFIDEFKLLDTAGQLNLAQTQFGLDAADVILFTDAEADKIKEYINSRSLHFGQSAFIALENLLQQAGIEFTREELARQLIAIDILAGVITPFDEGELLISMFAMRHYAASLGLSTEGLEVSFDGLAAFYESNSGHRIVAHINGEHYVIVTNIFEEFDAEKNIWVRKITYIDPGAGAEGQNQVMTITEEEFVKVWEGYILATSATANTLLTQHDGDPNLLANPPPRILENHELKEIRGSFFFFLIPFFAAIWSGMQAVAIAVVTAITQVAGAIGAALSQIAAGSFITGIQTAIGGLVTGFQTLAGAFLGFITNTLAAIPFVGNTLGTALAGVVGAVGNFGIGFVSGFITSFSSAILGNTFASFVLGVGGLLDVTVGGVEGLLTQLGVPPKIAHYIGAGVKIIGAIATGNITSVISTVASMAVQEIGPRLGISPALTSALSVAASALAGVFDIGNFDESLGTVISLKDVSANIFSSFAQAGFVAVGEAVGLDPRLTALINVPLGAAVGGFTGTVATGGSWQGAFTAAQNAIFSLGTAANLASVGAAIGLAELGAPPILQSFIPDMFGQIITGINGGSAGGGGPPDLITDQEGESLFNRITKDHAKFNPSNVGASSSNHTSFAQKTLESVGYITKVGFGRAVQLFQDVFSGALIEKLINIGHGSIVQAFESFAQITTSGIEFIKDGIEIIWDSTTDILQYTYDKFSGVFSALSLDNLTNLFNSDLQSSQNLGSDLSLKQTNSADQRTMRVEDNNGNVFLELLQQGREALVNAVGAIQNGVMKVFNGAISITFKDGKAVAFKLVENAKAIAKSFLDMARGIGGGLWSLYSFLDKTLFDLIVGREPSDDWDADQVYQNVGIPIDKSHSENVYSADELFTKVTDPITGEEQWQQNTTKINEIKSKLSPAQGDEFLASLYEIGRVVENHGTDGMYLTIADTRNISKFIKTNELYNYTPARDAATMNGDHLPTIIQNGESSAPVYIRDIDGSGNYITDANGNPVYLKDSLGKSIDNIRIGRGVHFHNVGTEFTFVHIDHFPPTSFTDLFLHGIEFASGGQMKTMLAYLHKGD